ncbi:Chromosomal replication initiator protein DnaA [Bienertia sinuspersici]
MEIDGNVSRMDVGQSAQSGRGKNKRSWTKLEEECLINGLLEMSVDPSWKADGSFKGGFKNKLEEKMNEKFPGCGLKAVPHIEFKIKWFKDKYNVLTEMFHTSGFSWDNEKHMIILRGNHMKFFAQHKNAQGLWNVPFPFYEHLTIIFGADRATGLQSKTFFQAIDNQEKETIELDKEKAKKEKTPKGQGTKRKMSEVMDLTSSFNNMSFSFSSYMNKINMHMSTIASAFSTTQQHEQAIMNLKKLRKTKRIAWLMNYFAYQNDEWGKEFIVKLIHPILDNDDITMLN